MVTVMNPPKCQRRIRDDVELSAQLTDSHGKIIPLPDRPNILVTSALPYVNNAPHLGNIIGSTLSADVFARYSRTGPTVSQVLYICGTDEYGTTTETKALEEGMTPSDLCDKYHQIHKDSYQWFDIGFDYFGRTTTPKQTEICQQIFTALHDKGHLTEHVMEQVYCENDARFLADRFVEGTCPKCMAAGARGDQCDTCCQTLDAIDLIDKKCKICSSTPISRKSKHLFLNLPKLQNQIETWYNSAKEGHHWSANGKAFTEAWLRDGLRERCLTRDLKWGVPVPLKGWEDKVMYVWFDAPIGYPSITANYTDDWKKWWKNPKEVTLYQFMGKDNVPFHTILFPAYLMGTGEEWTMLNHISTTEYLQYENVKFSKSNNVGVFGQNARETGVPSEVWRYFLISTRPETNDAQFTWTDFIAKANSELLNNLGNFVNRIVKFCNARYHSIVPNPSAWPVVGPPPSQADPSLIQDSQPSTLSDESLRRQQFDEDDQEFVRDIDNLLTQYIDSMESLKLRNGLSIVMAISARGNQYLQDNKIDYSLLLASPRRCAQIVLVSLNLVYLLSVLVHPFMPTTCDLILKQLNAPMRRLSRTFGIDLLAGHVIKDAIYLFRKIDGDRASFWRKQYGGNKPGVDGSNPSGGGGASDSKKSKKKSANKSDSKKPLSAFTGPKPPELVEIEHKLALQADLVRKLKASSVQGDVSSEVSRLLELKKDLASLTEKLAKSSIN